MGYKQKDIERVRKLFFRTKLRKYEDTIDNKSKTISKETKLKLRVVDKIIDLEILKLKNVRVWKNQYYNMIRMETF